MATKANSFRSLIAASGQTLAVESSDPPTSPRTAKTRLVGKRTAPGYVQVGVYLPKQLHTQAKLALLHEGSARDFSQLVGDLLARHLERESPQN